VNDWVKGALRLALYATLAYPLAAVGDDDEAPKSARQPPVPALSKEQQQAVGLRVAHPVEAKAPESSEALGLVLDETALLSDEGESSVAAAQEHSASAELARLRELYKGGAGASLRMLESAQAEEAKAQADAHLAAARFALRWGPLAGEPAAARERLEASLAAGRSVLVRADLPGRHVLGALPVKAVLDVDGIQVPGRVLGPLRQFTELQGAGLLIEVPNPPAGLSPGARVPMALLGAERAGLLLPRDALLYDESGAYVYKQLNAKTPGEKTRYVPVKVMLLVPYGDGWLVTGVDDDDDIVVHGAGVLWSLESMGAHAVDDDED
jgi:hypothetical protein